MPYKGNDLDLRIVRPAFPREAAPAERGLDAAWAQPAREGAPAIAVDDLVLACCNCAYDVAQFHGSSDVRLEHLLHALTRVAAAADMLGALGISAGDLRRETAVAIAAEVPAAPVGRAAAPRASAAFEDVLRRAAEQAGRRRAPTSVHDLLRTMLGGGPGSPAAMLLMRAAADPHRLERWRDEPLRESLAPAAPPPAPGMVPGSRPDLPSPVAEALLARLAQMEASFHALRADVAADRKALGDLLREVQGELQAFRAATPQAPAVDQTQAVAALMDTKLGAVASTMAALAERVAGLGTPAPAEADWQGLDTRFAGFEDRFAKGTAEVATALSSALSSTLAGRVEQAEAGLQRRQDAMERQWTSASERQMALEASVRAQLQAAEEASKAHERTLDHINEVLDTLRANQQTLGANQQTLGENLSSWQSESGGDIGIVSNRLQQLEQTVLDALGQLSLEVQALRQESFENGARRGNGFKRWLYGTGNVLQSSWREEAASMREAAGRPRGDERS